MRAPLHCGGSIDSNRQHQIMTTLSVPWRIHVLGTTLLLKLYLSLLGTPSLLGAPLLPRAL